MTAKKHAEIGSALNALKTVIGVDSRIEYRNAEGAVVAEGEGIPTGVLTLETEEGMVEMELDTFDAIYKSWVKCWPVVKPTKDAVVAEQRIWNGKERDAKRFAEKAAKEQAEAATKAEKEAAKAKEKAEKEAAAAAKKAEIEAKREAARKTMEEGAAAAKAKLQRDKEEREAKAAEAKAKMEAAKTTPAPADKPARKSSSK